MSKTILITGAAGLTGSFLVEKCLQMGDIVVGIDNYFRGNRLNIENAYNHENFIFLEADILDIQDDGKILNIKSQNKKNIQTDLSSYSFDEIYHLAAVVPTRYFYENPDLTYIVNCHGTYKLYKWARNSGIKKFVNASSSEIYGHCMDYAVKEDSETIYDAVEVTPRWSYAEGKILTEHILNQYKNEISVCHLRYANVYGPRDIDDNHVIPYIINTMIKGGKLILNKNAKEVKRSFLYMSDCAEATYKAMANMETGKAYNIGSNVEVTIYKLFEICRDELKKLGVNVSAYESGQNVEFSLHRAGDPVRRLLDTTRARTELGVVFETSLEEGIRSTCQWVLKKGR